MKKLALELLAALNELDTIENDFRMNMLMHKEYKDKKNAALHRIHLARKALSDATN